MEKLFEVQKIILDQFVKEPFYSRDIFQQITLDNRITGITGSRGIGKTTLMLHNVLQKGALENKALYFSADHLFFLENKIIEVVDRLYKETDIRFLCIDEIHKYTNWKQELKNIYDSYRDFKILFSGSSTIDIIRGKYDLSRRVILYPLHGLSFREYLAFSQGIIVPKINFLDLLNDHFKFANSLAIPKILKYFAEYLKTGYYPFFKEFLHERDKFQAIEHATQKTIYEDIATLHSLKTPTLLVIEKLFKYIIHAVPGEINANKLASALGKDFESVSEYLKYLEEAGLIRFLYSSQAGKAYIRNPIKMYPENPNHFYAYYLPIVQDAAIGKIREAFALNNLQNAGHTVFYNDIGDFKVDQKYIIEIGGKNKNNQQIKNHNDSYIFADGILLGDKNRIPLYLLGFIY